MKDYGQFTEPNFNMATYRERQKDYTQVPGVSKDFDFNKGHGTGTTQTTIGYQIKTMLAEIQGMLTARLTENVPYEEQSHLYVKVKIEEAFQVDVSLYNSATNVIVIKKYKLADLLKECTDIFKVTTMVDSDSKVLYNKSKENVFKQNTTLYI